MKTFKLQPDLLKSCAPLMSNDETRYYLKGVHIFEREGNLFYESTNGHALIRIQSSLMQEDDITGIDIIIPDFFVKELSKPAFLKVFGAIGVEYVDAVIDGQTITIEMPEGVASNTLIDGNYPSIDVVMPSSRMGISARADAMVNLHLLSKIAKSAKAFESYGVHLAIPEEHKAPYYFKQEGDLGVWEAVLMPIRA